MRVVVGMEGGCFGGDFSILKGCRMLVRRLSVSFTAAPLFVIAAIWFVGCGVSLLLICCCYCCCMRHPYYSKTVYAFCLCLLFLFTISAIVGCVVLYTGQGKFHESTTDTLNYVVSQSNNTVSSLKNVSSILSAAKDIEIDQVSLPSNVKTDIVRVHNMINDASKKLQFETRKNEKDIKHVLKDVRLALIIIAAVMLLVALLGFRKHKDPDFFLSKVKYCFEYSRS
ncbi:putative transmembrane protein [Helianthus annuus]|nr:putative transmembrane protein [Helianthus annuus]